MRTAGLVLRLALLATAAITPPLLLHQRLEHQAATEQALRLQVLHDAGVEAARALAPVLDQAAAAALIAAPATLTALPGGAASISLLYRPHGAATWFHVASTEALGLDLAALVPALDGTCGGVKTETAGRAAALVPAAGRDGCWIVVAAEQVADASPSLVEGAGTPLAVAAYAVMATMLAAAVWPVAPRAAAATAPERVNLSALVRELAQAVTAAQSGRLTVGAAVADGVWVRGPADATMAAIVGLLRDAVAASPSGGFLGIRLDGDAALTIECEDAIATLPERRRAVVALGGSLHAEPTDRGQRLVLRLA